MCYTPYVLPMSVVVVATKVSQTTGVLYALHFEVASRFLFAILSV